jgi:hypothetical protein
MPEITATINSGTANSQRMARAKNEEMNQPYVFMGNMNIQHTPQFYVRIFNIGYDEHKIERPWVSFNPAQRGKIIIIPACKPNEKYSKPFVIADIVQEPVLNVSMGNFLTRGVDGRFLAQDAINPEDPQGSWRTVRPMNQGMMMNEGTNLYNWGVFWTVNEVPAAEELAAAKERMESYFNYLIEEAKSLFMGAPDQRRQIGRTHRRAANYFGLEFEWNQIYRAKQECPGCGMLLPITAVVCQKCPATFNWQKAIELGLRTVDQAVAAGILKPQAEEMAKKPK